MCCLRNLFGGNDCTWILFFIIILLLADNDDCGCGCHHHHGQDEDEDEEDEDDSLDFIEYECPHCGASVYYDQSAFDLSEEHPCPSCGKELFPETPDEDE